MKINNLLKNNKVIAITTLLVVGGLIALITVKSYKANVVEDGIKLDVTQNLSIKVDEYINGELKQGLGSIKVVGGCMPMLGNTKNGTFNCLLTSSELNLKEFDITSIIYTSDLSGTTYPLLSGFEGAPVLRLKTSKQSMVGVKAVISANGEVSITYSDKNKLIIPIGAELQHGPGDCNGNGIVDDFDFIEVIRNFGGSGPEGDCTGDGKVDDFDFIEVIRNFGKDYNQQ